MSSPSILSFNLSVSDKHNISTITDPFQIMPATQNHISDKTLTTYDKHSNPNILMHMNYITHVFSDKAVMNDSTVRYSIRQYVKLGNILGTKNILIHTPYTPDEWKNLSFGMQVIKDEICDKGFIVHLEIPAWSKDMITLMKARDGDPVKIISSYLDTIFEYCSEFPKNSYRFVPDTAHMWANGCVKGSHFIQILEKYKDLIDYIHLNGNINPPFKMDTHAPIFDVDCNKITCWEEIVKHCSTMGVTCIAEVTKYGLEWIEWASLAVDYGFKIVKFNEKYTI